MTETDEFDLRQQLALALARIDDLEAEVVRRRGGRPRDLARLAPGPRIHQWRREGFIWYAIARRLKKGVRTVQVIYRDWQSAQATLSCAHALPVASSTIAA